MRFRVLVWVLIFAVGLIAGDRYGLPGWARAIGDQAFDKIEGWTANLSKPIPAADENDSASPAPPEDKSAGQAAPANDASNPKGNVGNASNANLKINQAGLNIIEESEGLRLEAYSAGGRWLIGYGHTRTAKAGMVITEAQAEALLREDVQSFENAVLNLVLVPVNENQFSAMVSLAYNLGSGGFSRSTVLEALNRGEYQAAADNFRNHNKVGGEVVPHLTERREKERALFLKPA